MLTPKDIENPSRRSGYDHVSWNGGSIESCRRKPWVATFTADAGGATKRGPRRAHAAEAAVDYCNYINTGGVASAPSLISAGHKKVAIAGATGSTHPKRAEAYRLLREAAADEGKDTSGYVYCITDGTKVKIGQSADHPQNRLAGLQTGNPRRLRLLGYLKVSDRHAEESRLHAKHIADNVLGEWFEPTYAIMADFGL